MTGVECIVCVTIFPGVFGGHGRIVFCATREMASCPFVVVQLSFLRLAGCEGVSGACAGFPVRVENWSCDRKAGAEAKEEQKVSDFSSGLWSRPAWNV